MKNDASSLYIWWSFMMRKVSAKYQFSMALQSCPTQLAQDAFNSFCNLNNKLFEAETFQSDMQILSSEYLLRKCINLKKKLQKDLRKQE